MAEVQFLFDNQLIAALERLIKEAKNKLMLVSPFIDLDNRIKDALQEKISKQDFELKILFGKNENNIYKSVKRDSMEFLKTFPNVEIRYCDRLHAKFYLNDFSYLMSSINLYDYSLANNIEVGIIGKYASKGVLGKVIDSSDALITQSVDKVKLDVLGLEKEIDPVEKFQLIFSNSELKYKTSPIVEDKKVLGGLMTKKNLTGYNVELDLLDNKKVESIAEVISKDVYVTKSDSISNNINVSIEVSSDIKLLSATQICKNAGIQILEFNKIIETKGLAKDNSITKLGLNKGLVMKSYMGRDYIAYPANILEQSQ